MKRAGFTMIELIFVIVILGILSAVALPKFIGVSEQAEAGKCKAMVGTLNRTVGPALWSDAVLNDTANLTDRAANGFWDTGISSQIDIPAQCGTSAEYASVLDGASQFTTTVGAEDYNVSATEPTTSEAPIWSWTKLNP
jgi:prepilin-type N-terminal cleavage/methylation domain-containing protein